MKKAAFGLASGKIDLLVYLNKCVSMSDGRVVTHGTGNLVIKRIWHVIYSVFFVIKCVVAGLTSV